MARYTRKEVAKKVGKSPNTIYRWEKEGKTPAPRRVHHNRQCVYTDELVEEIQKFIAREDDPPVRMPNTSARPQAESQPRDAA